MSRIKRLKLKGFKSFANPTVFNFENGFNTVVGANGSGKSNVFDALCFVLGRMSSKGLRADKLGNLVFNGGKHLKPAKEAEVSIFLSNDEKELLDVDLDEIKITRIVKKSGQSQYLLNNVKCTRTEIVEVLKRGQIDPDGYNIILQGDITKIVNMTTKERRELIEEISNISGYEEQRQKSLKKLDKIETDLRDADLILEEKTKFLKELKSEKEQAEKYNKAKDDLRFSSLLLTKSKIIKNEKLKEKKEEQLNKNEEVLEKHRNKLEDIDTKTKDIDEQISGLEKEIEVKSHNEFLEITNKITSLEAEVSNLKERKAELTKQIEEVKTRESSIKENIGQNKEKLKEFEVESKELTKKKDILLKEIKSYDEKIQKFKGSFSGDSFKKLDEIDEDIDALLEKKSNKLAIKQDNSIQVEKLNTKLEHLEGDLRRFEEQNATNKEDVDKLEDMRKKLKVMIVEISKTVNENTECSSKLSSLQKEYSALVEEHSKLRIKADASRDLIASNRAVETINRFKAQDSLILGTVSELASVPSRFSMAMESIAGKSLLNVVVEDDSTAVKYINYLKQNKVGAATFLPLNKMRTKFHLDNNVLNKPGVVDYALNLIKFDPKYTNVFHLIFQDTIVIEKIEDAKKIGIGDYKMVTLDGDVVAKTGAMAGGFKSRKKGLGAFKDDNVVEKVDEISRRMSSISNSIDLLKSQKDDSEKKISDLRYEKVDIEAEVAKLEKLLSIEGKDTKDIEREIEAIIGDKAVMEGSLKKSIRDIENLDSQIEDLQKQKAELKGDSSDSVDALTQINDLEKVRDEKKNELLELSSQIDNKTIQINNVFAPEIVNLEKILKENKESQTKMSENSKEIMNSIKEKNSELETLKKEEKRLSKGYKDIIEKRDEFREKKKALEKTYQNKYEQYEKVKEKSSHFRYEISQYDNLNNSLNLDLENQYNLIKSEFVTIDEEGNEKGMDKVESLIEEVDESIKTRDIVLTDLQTRVNNLKSKISSFGSINMKSVEIYDKLNEEFQELLEKREVLNKDKDEILEFVAQMDEKKRERFMETFHQLKTNFEQSFSKLSTKGEAELEIEDEKDLFNSGVEIKVRLSKRNYLDIKSLSGGEKTITAVAFIFAVQEFNPASFYIFDEIDAALDIMNCEKLGKLIASSAHKAQYVVVSHSEYLIQSSQSIYGVTMDKNKVSGVVSLDLKDMKEYVDSDASASE